jgi:formylmethanofuran dehydrogenase subunit E
MRVDKDLLKNTDLGTGELSPGSTKPRYEPEGGWQKHKERIHRESKEADKYKNLPFTFSKPKKHRRHTTVRCKNCGHIASAPINTVGIICSECKKYSSVEVLD